MSSLSFNDIGLRPVWFDTTSDRLADVREFLSPLPHDADMFLTDSFDTKSTSSMSFPAERSPEPLILSPLLLPAIAKPTTANTSSDRVSPVKASRGALKRVRHRQLDADRRHRENAAVDRIRALMRAADNSPPSQSHVDRATTLNNAADMLQRLQTAERKSQLTIDRLQRERAALISQTYSPTLDNMFAEVFLNSSVLQFICDADTGTLLSSSKTLHSVSSFDQAKAKHKKALIPRARFLKLERPTTIWEVEPPQRLADGTIVPQRRYRPDGSFFIKQSFTQPMEAMELFAQLYRNEKTSIETMFITQDFTEAIIPLHFRAWTTKCQRTFVNSLLSVSDIDTNKNQHNNAEDEYRTLIHLNVDVRQLLRSLENYMGKKSNVQTVEQHECSCT